MITFAPKLNEVDMSKFVRGFFSMRMMALGLIILLFAIAVATFLESIYDIQTAKIIIYNGLWFELLLVYLGISLIVNIFHYKMWAREKIAMLMFHLSFIIILIGAGVTRYVGFEGVMQLPEPDAQTGVLRPVDYIFSADPRIKIFIENKYVEETLFLSEVVKSKFDVDFKFPEKNKKINVELVDFQSKRIDSLIVNDTISNYVINIVTGGNESNYLAPGDFMMIGNIPLSFEKKDLMPGGIEVYKINGKMMFKTGMPMRYLPMSEMQKIRQLGIDVPDSMYMNVPVDTLVPFNLTTLYYIDEQSFVFKEIVNHAKMMRVSSGKKDVGSDYVTFRITDGKDVKMVTIAGTPIIPSIAKEERFTFNGLLYSFQYGAVPIRLPFSVACNDFTLSKYPGSTAPSSFESVVTVLDPRNDKEKTQRIFMNNVMDYNGFRFFQSSYFPDETGTVLSVNSDWWGTMITYVGYLMMSIGMLLSLFAPVGRFKELNGKLKKISKNRAKAGIISMFVLFSGITFGQHNDNDYHVHEDGTRHKNSEHAEVPEGYHQHEDGTVHRNDAHSQSGIEEGYHQHDDGTIHKNDEHLQAPTHSQPKPPAMATFMSEAHSDKLAYLMVQDYEGRIVPFHTLCDQLLRKIHRNNKFTDGDHTYNAVQTILSIHMGPDAWFDKKIIYVPKVLRESLGLNKNHETIVGGGTYASFIDLLTDDQKDFRLADEYELAHRKLDKEKGEFDKQLIKLVERFQVFSEIQLWQYMRMIPVRNDKADTWFTPFAQESSANEKELYELSISYFTTLSESIGTKDFSQADNVLAKFLSLQRTVAGKVAPPASKIKMEVSYNKMNIFKNAQNSYFLFGFVLLIIFLIRILSNAGGKEGKGIRLVKRIFTVLIAIIFVYHGAGLAMRWYISGHAPWSNGYEAVVFIAWITVIAGFIFSKKNPVILAATCILAYCMLFVTDMNILDPEITPLVPVLKSYWLMIHVAIITGSYGFLGLGAILGLINLLLYIFRNKKNGKVITWNINELTYVSEMTITIGLFMLTIGTFLGGVWANESWGRYWGWDPKETWALVSVLVYAVLLHLRFIPALKSKFIFNVVSFWSYAAILFTFFGVNFYLVGLHSYAQGDGLGEFPFGVIVATVLFYAFTEFASLKNKRYSTSAEKINLSYFLRKIVITSSIFIVIYLLFVLLKVINWNEAIDVAWKTVAVIAVTNLLLFIYQMISPNKYEEVSEEF